MIDLQDGVLAVFAEAHRIHQDRVDAAEARRADLASTVLMSWLELTRSDNSKASLAWQKANPDKSRRNKGEYRKRRYARDEAYRERKKAAAREWARQDRARKREARAKECGND